MSGNSGYNSFSILQIARVLSRPSVRCSKNSLRTMLPHSVCSDLPSEVQMAQRASVRSQRGRCLHTPESSQRIPRTAGNRKPEELTCRAHLWNASSAHRTERWSARSLWRRCHCRRASSGRRRSRSPPGISHCPWTPLRGRRRKKHRAVRACLCWPITSCQQLLATCDPILGLNYVIVCRSSRLTC